MVYHIGLAEIKSQHKASMKWQLNDAKDVNCCCELEAPIIRHDGIIKQGVRDANRGLFQLLEPTKTLFQILYGAKND